MDGVRGDKPRISLTYDDHARYSEALLNAYYYRKSLIRQGPGWGRRGAVFVQGLVGACKLLSDLATQSGYTCAPLELCTRVELNAYVKVARGSVDNCHVGGAEEHVSWLGDELNVGGFGAVGQLAQGYSFSFIRYSYDQNVHCHVY